MIQRQATVRKPAPAFTANAVLKDGSFGPVSLSDYLGQYLVLFFYPCDFTFVCPTEIIAFSDRVAEFTAIKTSVLACSTDTKFSHLAWTQQSQGDGGLGKMNFPLLADVTKSISKDYGVLISDPSDEEAGVAMRGLFIIDPKGTLRHITINDLPVGRNVDEVLRLIQAFQYVEVHGEVCPANWVLGKDTIVPSPEGSKKFFSKKD